MKSRARLSGSSFEALVVSSHGRRVRLSTATGQEFGARFAVRHLQVVCGDRVDCRLDQHGEAMIEAIHPRSTLLCRSDSRGRSEPVVANLTLLGIVVAPQPTPDWFMVDRYLSAAAGANLAALIVLNKIDLPGSSELESQLAEYRQLGYLAVTSSVSHQHGLDALASTLKQHVSAFVGQSGVGKSSLINALLPDNCSTVGELTRDLDGRHTTTAARLCPIGEGLLADTPGVRDFAPALDMLDPLSLGFTEVAQLAPACRFGDCRHDQEPGCAVHRAVEQGSMTARRYESYRRLQRLHKQLGPAASHNNKSARS